MPFSENYLSTTESCSGSKVGTKSHSVAFQDSGHPLKGIDLDPSLLVGRSFVPVTCKRLKNNTEPWEIPLYPAWHTIHQVDMQNENNEQSPWMDSRGGQ
ncbi:hypothetical protein JTB14_002514 [Gonioctena quinquepunctata]|nr:hypothetical protein JTB14_002514 [Gonioctena quinquepunctata]